MIDQQGLPTTTIIPVRFNCHADDHLYLVASHAYWKEKLYDAITNKEMLDVETISKDDCCELGKWLHSEEVHPQISHLQSYHNLIEKHAAFHIEAGNVARMINTKKYDVALRLLDCSSAFERASIAVIADIFALKAEHKRSKKK
jgi:methyl-accepting chemotaxis protein